MGFGLGIIFGNFFFKEAGVQVSKGLTIGQELIYRHEDYPENPYTY